MESETVGLDSMAVQRLKHNVDMKDFSTCLYYEDVTLNSIIYDNFEAEYNARSSDRNWVRDHVCTQLQKVEYNKQTDYNNNDIAFGNLWKIDPYVSYGYWTKWAMIGGYPPYGKTATSWLSFPGLELKLDKSDYRQGGASQHPDGGHLASSAYGKEIYNVSQYLAPAMYSHHDRNDHHRYTGGFMTQKQAVSFFTAMVYADCRMAAAIRNAAYKVSRLSPNVRGLEEVYKRIEKIYGRQKIYLEDEQLYAASDAHVSYIKNKAEFCVMNVPLMIYADYGWFGRQDKYYDKFIKAGTIMRNDDVFVIYDEPKIVWRLDRTIGDQVVSDNELFNDIFGKAHGAVQAKSLLGNIKNLKFATYRQNAYHTAFGSGSNVSNYDVCVEKRPNGSYYLKPEIKEFDYNSSEFEKNFGAISDYKFEIKDIMK